MAHDVGQCINPVLVMGQIEGGVYMGLGEVMMEESAFRRLPRRLSGALVHKFPSLLEYKSPTFRDMPKLHSYIIEDPDAEGPFGAKEVGQGPLLPVMPAVANAIFDAVGVRVDQVPIHPHMVLAALEKKAKGEEPRFGPDRFPEIDFGETLIVPTPAEGGDGRAINDWKEKLRSDMRSAGTMTTREEALKKGALTTPLTPAQKRARQEREGSARREAELAEESSAPAQITATESPRRRARAARPAGPTTPKRRAEPMLRLPPFTLRQPTSIEEAAKILAGEGPAARLVAGGTDLYPNLKRRHQKAETVVSLLGVRELAGVTNGDGVTLGATTTLAAVAADPRVRTQLPALARAVESISSPPLREMGTIGGNVCLDTRCTYYNQTEEWRHSIDYCMKAEGTICWVAPSSPRCWAHSASDSAPMLCALEAEVRLVSAEGERTVPLEALYRDDGIEYLAKRAEEIVTAIRVPATSAAPRVQSAFWKLRRRGSIDFAVLSAAVAFWVEGNTIERAAIWLGRWALSPRSADKAAAFLAGKPATAEVLAEAAELAKKAATPMDNTDFQAQWRKAVVGKYVEAALREAAGLPVERLAPRGRLASHRLGAPL